MDPSLGFLFLVFITLLGSFLSAIENALSSLGRVRLTALLKEHPEHRTLLQDLMDRPAVIVSSITFLRDITMTLAAIVAIITATGLLPNAVGISIGEVGLALGIIAFYLIIVGEWIPKYTARDHMGGWIVRFMKPIYILTRPFIPVLTILQQGRKRLLKLLGIGNGELKEVAPVSEDQIKYLLEAAEEHGLLDEQEEQMIWRILAYDDLVVRQVMVPRPEVVTLDVYTPIEEAKEIIEEHGFSRYPVYEETTDNIIGMLYAKDLLRYGSADRSLREFVRQPFFTPMIKPINNLLKEFQRNKKHIAIVVDEFGSMAGIVTLEDVLEEIVGEITDEFDQPEETQIRKVSKTEYLIEGDTELSTINEQLVLNLPIDGAVTIGGLITQHLEEIPQKGRSVKIEDINLMVEDATAREIVRVRLKIPESVISSNGHP